MAKRHDKNDSTMDISVSQLVPEKRPQPPVVNKNDVSMWIGGVVGADEFAGTKKKSKTRAPLVLALIVLLAAAAGGAYYMFNSGSSTPVAAPSPARTPPDAAPAGSAEPAIATMPVDAAVEVAPVDAGAAAPLVVDAVSAADPAPKKKTTKKKTVKKPVKKKR